MNYRRLSQPKTVRFIILGSIILSLFFGQLHYKQWQKKRQIAAEIAELTKQQQDIEQKNKELAESLAYLTSGNYKEKIARQQLNLKKEGEIVYNFNEAIAPATSGTEIQRVTVGSRIKSWWLYFFKI